MALQERAAQKLTVLAALAALSAMTAIPTPVQAQDPTRMLGPLGAPLGMILRGVPRPRVGVPQRRQPATRAPVTRAPAAARNAPAAERPASRRQLAQAAPALWPAAAPSAYEDMLGYALWPSDYGSRFWAHGHRNIMLAMVAPSAAMAMAREATPRRARGQFVSAANAEETTGSVASATCIQRSREFALRPVDRIAETIDLTPTQRGHLDALRTAVAAAVDRETASCRDELPMTAPERLHAMVNSLWAMRYAEFGIRTSLETFYGSLDDAQKMQLSDLQARHETPAAAMSPAAMCGASPPARADWTRQIERTVRPTPEQRESLKMLHGASMEMMQFLMTTCPDATPTTAIGRFNAAGDRVMTLIHAAMNIEPLFNDFYFRLSDAQKARFETLVR
jgi:hypothetical protein